jgi:hypothetical protein
LQGYIPRKLEIPEKKAISKDFSMGVDITSTPAGNEDRPFANPGVLQGYFSPCLQVPGSGLNPGWIEKG